MTNYKAHPQMTKPGVRLAECWRQCWRLCPRVGRSLTLLMPRSSPPAFPGTQRPLLPSRPWAPPLVHSQTWGPEELRWGTGCGAGEASLGRGYVSWDPRDPRSREWVPGQEIRNW